MTYLISYALIGVWTAFIIELYINGHEDEFNYHGMSKENFLLVMMIYGFFLWPIYWGLVLFVIVEQLFKRKK